MKEFWKNLWFGTALWMFSDFFFSIRKSIRNVAWHSCFEAENETCLADPNWISPSLIALHPEVTIETTKQRSPLCSLVLATNGRQLLPCSSSYGDWMILGSLGLWTPSCPQELGELRQRSDPREAESGRTACCDGCSWCCVGEWEVCLG